MKYRPIAQTFFAVVGITSVSCASFLVALPLGFFVLGVFSISIAVGDRLSERRSLSDSKRSR